MQERVSDSKGEVPAASGPAISLPKGGGAIRGIGEKFSTNPATGTGSMSVPIATSPARSGFHPQLALSYDSGSGNGPFGFGWTLSIPSIARKTDKGLPRYRDSEESDVYILSGSEDLVPIDGLHAAAGFTIRRYHPRIEGLFARIERWTEDATREVHWRSISRDNITAIYGRTPESRIADPADPARIFSWLLCESDDDKGNAIVYSYRAEDDAGVDGALANERNRVRGAQRYLTRIRYGNRISRFLQPDPEANDWMFEVVLDYGEGRCREASPRVLAASAPPQRWRVRPDSFSQHRAGFEVRLHRRCERILMFHRFPELGPEPCLVRSTDLDYADLDPQSATVDEELAHRGSTRFGSFLCAIAERGFVRDAAAPPVDENGVRFVSYTARSFPPLELEYSDAAIRDEVRELDAASLENLPAGIDGASVQLADLDGEGLFGLLLQQPGAWYYKPNLGEGRFAAQTVVAAQPSLAAAGAPQQLLDLAGDGQLDVVAFAGPTPGFFERIDESWEPFRPFEQLPHIEWDQTNLRFVDLNGDGHADVLIAEDEVFTWYPSLAESGFGPAERVATPFDEERGPRLIGGDERQSIHLADMSGDGLLDLVRIRNGEIVYWPNQGYGRFGAKVTMDGAPLFDRDERFDRRRLRLADIDGSGTSDIIDLAPDGARIYFNQSGNRWSDARSDACSPRTERSSRRRINVCAQESFVVLRRLQLLAVQLRRFRCEDHRRKRRGPARADFGQAARRQAGPTAVRVAHRRVDAVLRHESDGGPLDRGHVEFGLKLRQYVAAVAACARLISWTVSVARSFPR